MNITNTPWLYPALLERREGIEQPVRAGSNSDIRAGLTKLLGLDTTRTHAGGDVCADGRRADGAGTNAGRQTAGPAPAGGAR